MIRTDRKTKIGDRVGGGDKRPSRRTERELSTEQEEEIKRLLGLVLHIRVVDSIYATPDQNQPEINNGPNL